MGFSILLWTNFENISWFLIFAVHSQPRNIAKITQRENFPFYGITQDWVPSRADIKKQVKFKFYQAHNEFIPTASASALDPEATRLGMSLKGSYPVKVSAIKDLETLSRDTIKILSQAEIFSFAAFKSMQSENMDSEVLFEILKSMSRSITD